MELVNNQRNAFWIELQFFPSTHLSVYLCLYKIKKTVYTYQDEALGMFSYAFNFYNILSNLEASNNLKTRAYNKVCPGTHSCCTPSGVFRSSFLPLSLSFMCSEVEVNTVRSQKEILIENSRFILPKGQMTPWFLANTFFIWGLTGGCPFILGCPTTSRPQRSTCTRVTTVCFCQQPLTGDTLVLMLSSLMPVWHPQSQMFCGKFNVRWTCQRAWSSNSSSNGMENI